MPDHSRDTGERSQRPNVILVFGDQWRGQATGYAGDPNVHTPNIDRLAGESINFTHAVSGCPVCSPARASLLTGQYPLTHGVFVNDVCLSDGAVSMAQAFDGAGYDTAHDSVAAPVSDDGEGAGIFMLDLRTGNTIWRAGRDNAANLQLSTERQANRIGVSEGETEEAKSLLTRLVDLKQVFAERAEAEALLRRLP